MVYGVCMINFLCGYIMVCMCVGVYGEKTVCKIYFGVSNEESVVYCISRMYSILYCI